MDNKNLRKDLFELIKKEAFFKKKVILSSGKTSNYYIDIRLISLQSKGAFLISSLFWEMIKNDKFSNIGGPTLGADPILSALAYHAYVSNSELKTFIVRKSPKGHGQGQFVEGPSLRENSRVILIDDVATSGGSLVEVINKLEPLKLNMTKALVVIDREEGAKEALAKFNLPLSSIFTLSEFV